jgi:hypothetical protein
MKNHDWMVQGPSLDVVAIQKPSVNLLNCLEEQDDASFVSFNVRHDGGGCVICQKAGIDDTYRSTGTQ